MYQTTQDHFKAARASTANPDKGRNGSVRDWTSMHDQMRQKSASLQEQQHSIGAGHPFHVQLPTHEAHLRRFALKLTGSRHRADDLVQETFLKAWTKRDQFSPGTDLRGWLFTILRNAFFSDLRKYKREVEDIDGKLAAALFDEASQEHAVALNQLLTAIALLPESQQRALLMTGAYGFSQIEAATACGCSLGTIKSRVSRARARLVETIGS